MTDNSKKYCTFSAELLKVVFAMNLILKSRKFRDITRKSKNTAGMRICLFVISGIPRTSMADNVSPQFSLKKQKTL